MRLGHTHLTYSLNVFPAEDVETIKEVLTKHLPIVRDSIPANGKPFGVGLWLSATAAAELQDPRELDEFHNFIMKMDYYVFTVNAFPYGIFHGDEVKQRVYQPNWLSRDRVEYTKKVAAVLSHLLPTEMTGSISTLPGGYKPDIAEADHERIARHFLEVGECLQQIHDVTGKRIVLAVEMEPDCLWETPDEFIAFYQRFVEGSGYEDYIGVCYDTCHQELLGDVPGSGLKRLLDAGITIGKLQLSAAIEAPTGASKDVLRDSFEDIVYLHQTRAGQDMKRYADLSDALREAELDSPWLVHYHVPVYCTDLGGELTAAKAELNAILGLVRQHPRLCSNLELETYTYAVLPESVRGQSIEESMAREYRWVMDRLA